jgi:hypothetical protein
MVDVSVARSDAETELLAVLLPDNGLISTSGVFDPE